MTHLSHREMTLANMDMYVGLARKALAYYKAKNPTVLIFQNVTVGAMHNVPECKVHINFVANSDNESHLFFAELVREEHASVVFEGDFEVKGCCLMEKIDSGNPLGRGCYLCCYEVIHPGPQDGYRIVRGDAFRGYQFWEYIFQSSYRTPVHTCEDMYVACAQKALEYYNDKQHVNLKAAVAEFIDGAWRVIHDPNQRIIHVNFKSCAPEQEQELYFAELSIPFFDIEVSGWDARKEPFIKVRGCCKLKKLNSGNPFGRVCEVCYLQEVIHPSPRNGYCVGTGDDFSGYQFLDIGQGIY